MSLIPSPFDEGQFKVVASSSGNKTYKEHLDSLFTAYNSLTRNERRRTVIAMGNLTLYNCASGNTEGAYVIFSVAAALNRMYFYTMRIGNGTSNYVDTSINIPTVGGNAVVNSKTDHTSESYDDTIQLLLAL